jgi:hypothetical protein
MQPASRRRTTGSLLYRWSRRWMAAQMDLRPTQRNRVAGCKAHLARMKTLEKQTILMGGNSREGKNRFLQRSRKEANSMKGTGVLAPWEGAAVRFYRLEAENWLRQAQRGR